MLVGMNWSERKCWDRAGRQYTALYPGIQQRGKNGLSIILLCVIIRLQYCGSDNMNGLVLIIT
jgi:hypothetical protein